MVDDQGDSQQQNPPTQSGGGGEGSQQADTQETFTSFMQQMTAMM